MAFDIEYFCISNKGNIRKINQDNYLCAGQIMPQARENTAEIIHGTVSNEDECIFSVFDGLGGEKHGEVAAFIAAGCFEECEPGQAHRIEGSYSGKDQNLMSLADICYKASNEICDYAKWHGECSMGTTVAAIRFEKSCISICNVGDSKILRITENKLSQLSVDDLCICAFGVKPPLLQYLGIPPEKMIIEPNLKTFDYKDKDVYLVCTDGLSDMVSEEFIRNEIKTKSGEEAVKSLMKTALENGGRDNITYIILYVKKSG